MKDRNSNRRVLYIVNSRNFPLEIINLFGWRMEIEIYFIADFTDIV
jgi:hypothetical protein